MRIRISRTIKANLVCQQKLFLFLPLWAERKERVPTVEWSQMSQLRKVQTCRYGHHVCRLGNPPRSKCSQGPRETHEPDGT